MKRDLAVEDKKLIRYLQGKSSPQEREEILTWLDRPGSREELNQIVERYLEKPDPQGIDETDYRKLLDSIHQKIQIPAKKEESRWTRLAAGMLKVAASLAVIIGCTYYITQFSGPGGSQVVDKVKETSTIVRETRSGEKLVLTLPDQTKITLNSLSKISFPSDYGRSERAVFLEGEAYLEISPDKEKPFRLETGSVTTTALGTAFNAFSREGQIKIALTEGRVRVVSLSDKVELAPGDMASLEDRMDKLPEFRVMSFDTSKVVAWKEGRIVFDRKSLKDILKDLEDWYGVRMEVQKGVDLNRRVIGEFNNRSLHDILTGLGFSMGLEHKINGNHVTIRPS